MTSVIRQTWERQSASWRLVPLDTPDSLQAQQWAACQVDPVSGAVRTWIPRPPVSAPRENVWQTLQADLAPGASEPPLPSHWETIQAQWVQTAFPAETALPLGPAITVRADHPVLAAWPVLSLAESSAAPQWAVVAQTIAGRTRWMALQATSTADGVQLQPLHRLDDPGKLWLAHDPTVLEHTITALTGGAIPAAAAFGHVSPGAARDALSGSRAPDAAVHPPVFLARPITLTKGDRARRSDACSPTEYGDPNPPSSRADSELGSSATSRYSLLLHPGRDIASET